MSNTPHIEEPPLPDGLEEVGGTGISFELGVDGIWRAWDVDGIVAVAPTWRQIYERIGGRWN